MISIEGELLYSERLSILKMLNMAYSLCNERQSMPYLGGDLSYIKARHFLIPTFLLRRCPFLLQIQAYQSHTLAHCIIQNHYRETLKDLQMQNYIH